MTRQYRPEELADMPDRKLLGLRRQYVGLLEHTRHPQTERICIDMMNSIDRIRKAHTS